MKFYETKDGYFTDKIKRIDPPSGNGVVWWKCPKGHISNYLDGSGTRLDPFNCPQCLGDFDTIGKSLTALNEKRKGKG